MNPLNGPQTALQWGLGDRRRYRRQGVQVNTLLGLDERTSCVLKGL